MPDTPIERGEPASYPPSLEARVAVLEEVVRRIDAKLDRIETRLDKLDSLEIKLAELRGIVQGLPTTWQMITAIIGGQVALAAMLFGAARLLGVHG